MADPVNTIISEIPNTEDAYFINVFDDSLYCSGGPITRVELLTMETGVIVDDEVAGCSTIVDFRRPVSVPPDVAGAGQPDRRIYLATSHGIGEIIPALFDQFTPIPTNCGLVACMVGVKGRYLYYDDLDADALGVVDLDAHGGPRLVGSIPLGLNAIDLAVSPDDRFIYASHPRDEAISVIDISGPFPSVRTVPVANGPSGLALSADGKRLFVAQFGIVDSTNVTGHGPGTLSVFDTATMHGLWIYTGKGSQDVVVNTAGTRAYVSNNGADTVSVVDVTGSPVVIDTITGFHSPGNMGLSVDQRRLYVTQLGSTHGVAVVAV